jgi:calcium-translocating P-type ATPase
MRIQQLPATEALGSLHTGMDGLTPAEARRRLLEFGLNRVERIEGTSLLLRFLQCFVHFFALILWLAAGLAFVAELYDPGSGMATLGLAIVGVVVLNGVFSFWQEYRAERALSALQRLLPHQVKALRQGNVCPIPAEEVVPGDVLLLDAGDDIPADCRLLEAHGLRVNNATITGESLPLAREASPCSEDDLLHARNVLLAGTSVVSGEGRGLVFATGMHTEFGKIAHLTQSGRHPLSPLQREIARLSRLIAALAVVLGVVFFALGQTLGLGAWASLLFGIGVIVANVPEGLLPTVTLALAMASQRMARRQALVRHLPAVEALGCASVICTDKTGTLTQNQMVVRHLFLGGRTLPVEDLPASAEREQYRDLLLAAQNCHGLRRTNDAEGRHLLGDPMEIALVEMADRLLPPSAGLEPVDVLPFDTDRKRLSTLCEGRDGLVLYTKGAPETVLPLCRHVRIGAEVVPLSEQWKERFLVAQEILAGQGLRVLAFACRSLVRREEHADLERDMVLTGLVGLLDPPRLEVPEAIRCCKQAGIKVIMITGDHPHTAVAVARQIGLVEGENPVVVTGDQMRRLSPAQLQLALDAPEILFARVSADQKLRIVTTLKAKKHVVAVTGDGVNDAPALRQADIGIAMGRSGTDVARESADLVLLDDNFASIVAAVEEGRAVYANMRKFLTYGLTSNVAELVPYLAFVLFRVPLALTVIQMLAVDLGTNVLPALALGAEKPDPETMTRPPRPRREHLLSAGVLARAYLFLGPLESLGSMVAFFFVLLSAGWVWGKALGWTDPLYLRATTACLCTVVIMQAVNVFQCRSERHSILGGGLLGNPLILAGVVGELALLLLITYTPAGNALFGTAPVGVDVWLFALPFALLMLALEEMRKAWVRRREWGSSGTRGPGPLKNVNGADGMRFASLQAGRKGCRERKVSP